MRLPLLATIVIVIGVALAGCQAEESNESGAGTGASGVGEGGDDVDPCDDGSAVSHDIPEQCDGAAEG